MSSSSKPVRARESGLSLPPQTEQNEVRALKNGIDDLGNDRILQSRRCLQDGSALSSRLMRLARISSFTVRCSRGGVPHWVRFNSPKVFGWLMGSTEKSTGSPGGRAKEELNYSRIIGRASAPTEPRNKQKKNKPTPPQRTPVPNASGDLGRHHRRRSPVHQTLVASGPKGSASVNRASTYTLGPRVPRWSTQLLARAA